MDTTSTFIIIFALVAMSAFFSASETAFSSLSRSRLKIMADDGNKKAARVLAMSEDYDKLLSTILVGNNIVNIAMTSIATIWFTSVMLHGGATASTVFSTVVVLIFGEITPKSLAKEVPEKVAIAVQPLLSLCVTVLTPINWLFSLWKQVMNKVVKVKEDRRVDGEELLAIVTEAEREGGIDDVESTLIKSAIEFGDHNAIEISTPRVDVVAVSENDSRERVAEVFIESGFSRLPVYSGSIDNIVGVIHHKEFFTGKDDWKKGMQEPVFVTETIDIGSLLQMMQRKKCHLAVICDEFGGTAGIVTMEDILEELVGEIWDEHDETVEEFEEKENGDALISGDLSLEDMFENLEIKENDEFESTSVAGWVMEMLEVIPSEGDSFEYGGYRFTVTEMSVRRIVSIKAEKPQEVNN
ncbi:MAG: HlyC/CorC family transporter [Clostridia bacterium]|nr:HlyC/CorC family transporter [Clostridia bacterium]